MSSMIKNLLRRFGYYKLNDEDKLALAKHYNPRYTEHLFLAKNKHLEYFGLDPITCIMLIYPNSKIRISYTCGLHEDVV